MNKTREAALDKLARQIFDDANAYASCAYVIDSAMAARMGMSLLDFQRELPKCSKAVHAQRYEAIEQLQVTTVVELFKTLDDTRADLAEIRAYVENHFLPEFV
jgi:hypothetical protein